MAKQNRLGKVDYDQIILQLIIAGVFASGLLLLLGVLGRIVHFSIFRRFHSTNDARVGIDIIIGVSLIYLGSLLNRRKYIAWIVTLIVYGFLLGASSSTLITRHYYLFGHSLGHLLTSVVFPLVIVAGLVYYKSEFNVKSDVRSFTLAVRFAILALLIALLYGFVGFLILDKRDFHQEITAPQALYYTVDQFNFASPQPVTAYTDRGKLFLYSLTVASITSLGYVAISLFQPIRARLSDQTNNREEMERLLRQYGGSSEDFFKLWPHDKTYYISIGNQSALAYHVERGVALVVGDIAGNADHATGLLKAFDEVCRTNDWLPAFIHTEPKWTDFYKHNGYNLQKIGEEAVVDVEHFINATSKDKYFRQIKNRFEKQEFTFEYLEPPHKQALLARLKVISDDWLNQAGRSERGLMMGYFSDAYLQLCPVMVARDAAGTIQAFVNQIPSYDPHEANFDLLRHASGSPGNINDFLLLKFIGVLHEKGFKRFNLGLSPLAGMDESPSTTVVNNVLNLVYSYGNRFYSFSGLYKFKAKYEPKWQDRFIAYKGSLRSFSRSLTALNRAMSKSPHRRLPS